MNKILLHSNHSLPNIVISKLIELSESEDYPLIRMGEIIPYIEKISQNGHHRSYESIKTLCKLHPTAVYQINEKEYAFWDKNSNQMGYFLIGEVDTSKPWTIDNYDGQEQIKYIEIKNEKINFCEVYYH